jgi:hypothetical protein
MHQHAQWISHQKQKSLPVLKEQSVQDHTPKVKGQTLVRTTLWPSDHKSCTDGSYTRELSLCLADPVVLGIPDNFAPSGSR